jgi:hypothetical protein
MASTSSPFGLKPVNLIGGGPYQGGTLREYPVKANNSAAIFHGATVLLTTAGLPVASAATPVAEILASTSVPATAGLMGVMQGARYTNTEGQVIFNQYLPANSVTAGFTDIVIFVNDDPNTVFQIQGNAALGTFNSGTNGSGFAGAVGKNAAIEQFSGSTTTGKSNTRLIVGTNGGSIGTTNTLGFRIIGVVPGTESDSYPEFLVKYNVGVHSYYNSTGI